MGIILNRERARSSVCYCKTYRMGDGEEREICWTRGIVGSLSQDQINDYCPIELKRPLPQKIDTTELKDLLFGTNRDAERLIG